MLSLSPLKKRKNCCKKFKFDELIMEENNKEKLTNLKKSE